VEIEVNERDEIKRIINIVKDEIIKIMRRVHKIITRYFRKHRITEKDNEKGSENEYPSVNRVTFNFDALPEG
jgi:hypothetical protein